jgi:anti-anti-sigma factor
LRLDRDPDGVTRLWLVGEFDLAAAPGLDAALRQAQSGSDRVVVDLRQLVFLDCTCLQTLLVAHACAQRAGVRLTIAHPPRAVKHLLALTGTADRLTIVHAGVEALWAVPASPPPLRLLSGALAPER